MLFLGHGVTDILILTPSVNHPNDSPVDESRMKMAHPIREGFFLAETTTDISKRRGVLPRYGKVSVKPQAAPVSSTPSTMTFLFPEGREHEEGRSVTREG